MDSKFTFYRGTSSLQIDLALCNNVDIMQSFIMHNKLPQSDDCPCSIKALLTYQPSLVIISECSSGFKSYHHFDISKRIKRRIYINRIDLNILSDNLSRLGDDIHSQYINTNPSQMSIDNFSDDLTNGIYECFMKSKICNVTITRQPTQRNCTSHNFKAIGDVHYKRFSDLIGIASVLASYHKNEWLFYQTQSWRKEEEELNKSTNRKWKLYLKSDPKKLWTMLDWKGQ